MAESAAAKTCWGPGSSLWPAAPWIPSAITTAPCLWGLRARRGVRAGGETETWFREKAAGGGGGAVVARGNLSHRKGWLPRDALSREPRDTLDPEVVQVFTEGRARRGAGRRTGTGPEENPGGRRQGGGQGREPRAGRLPEAPRAAGRTRRLLARGPRPRRPRGTRGSGRGVRPRTGRQPPLRGPWKQVMVRSKRKGRRQAGICLGAIITTALLPGGQQRGQKGPPEKKAGQAEKEAVPGMTATSGVEEGIEQADFMGELVKGRSGTARGHADGKC